MSLFVRQPRRLSIQATMVLLALLVQPQVEQPLRAAAEGFHPSTVELTGDSIFAKLLEHSRLREARLRQYSVPSTYRVRNDKGTVRAEAR
ncbi:MAG: hypothetical protein ABI882_13660, partial [Acidobacteriota bacterium]